MQGGWQRPSVELVPPDRFAGPSRKQVKLLGKVSDPDASIVLGIGSQVPIEFRPDPRPSLRGTYSKRSMSAAARSKRVPRGHSVGVGGVSGSNSWPMRASLGLKQQAAGRTSAQITYKGETTYMQEPLQPTPPPSATLHRPDSRRAQHGLPDQGDRGSTAR